MLQMFAFQTGKNSRGFTLTEVLIAVVVLSVGLLGMFAMTITTIRSISFSNKHTTAATLAQDKMEDIRNKSYANVTAANYPVDDYSNIPDYPQFKRTVTINPDNPVPGTKTVTVTVSWKKSNTSSGDVTLSTIISQ